MISIANPACFDADAVSRPAGETLAAQGERAFHVDPVLVTRYARACLKPSPQNAVETSAAAEELQEVVRRALGDDRMLETDAPADVWANVWLDDTRQVLALHLVNGRSTVRPTGSGRQRQPMAGATADRPRGDRGVGHQPGRAGRKQTAGGPSGSGPGDGRIPPP